MLLTSGVCLALRPNNILFYLSHTNHPHGFKTIERTSEYVSDRARYKPHYIQYSQDAVCRSVCYGRENADPCDREQLSCHLQQGTPLFLSCTSRVIPSCDTGPENTRHRCDARPFSSHASKPQCPPAITLPKASPPPLANPLLIHTPRSVFGKPEAGALINWAHFSATGNTSLRNRLG